MKVQKQTRSPRRQVDGVLLLDKHAGLTSNAALQTARRLLNAAKAGHTGTLDPMATGLLPLTFGEATKFSQMLLDADKEYEATVQLGVETDTGDAEGAVVATTRLPAAISREAILSVLPSFTGEIEQIPPIYSALKRAGKPLYEYARAGIEVEIEPRRITIHALELLDWNGSAFRIRVACSKGTYIRTLGMDLGRALGCGAHLSALRRTRIGPFNVTDAVSVAVLEATEPAQRDRFVASADTLVRHLAAVELGESDAGALMQGRVIRVDPAICGLVRVYEAANSRFLGLAQCMDGRLAAKRLVATTGSVQPE
ncbi:MAG TPA: tRNA pseudouridine(55) synthase TruB [Aromatoleum sp.]|uniref:tRNA pseudouridine(55) synthase TruB n=1 Tax=Aromatoleum sp. TaxID=2307007 RepID=UPI002B48B98A|nr:tRNA pseudouridine(55) synthase TruB [Aromatoleum sp.]HJV25730.1 tRNA pseudouridine(55) synthase TruB [Aromatoleum sp.]